MSGNLARERRTLLMKDLKWGTSTQDIYKAESTKWVEERKRAMDRIKQKEKQWYCDKYSTIGNPQFLEHIATERINWTLEMREWARMPLINSMPESALFRNEYMKFEHWPCNW